MLPIDADLLPIDADLLHAVILGYKKPSRLLPYGVKPKLTDDEMTTLRRLGKPLPCHLHWSHASSSATVSVNITRQRVADGNGLRSQRELRFKISE
ncbi:hypothetical protein PIB30_110060, partial [Stylosanthes scabra]|nr:hypothetical protein [Stylosanthes scabra]